MGLKTKRWHFLKVLLLIAIIRIPLPGMGQVMVVNSYNNEPDPKDEWTELIVIQDNINLSGWKLQDNNSLQTSPQEAIIFRNIPFWNNIRGGTIIVINHRTAGNLPVSLDKQGGYIRVNADDATYFSGGEFPNNTLNIATGGDFLQILNPSGVYAHGLGHKIIAGSSFENAPSPKLNHSADLSFGNALYVYPGNELNAYGWIAPQVGTTYTAMGNSKVPGLPNPGVQNSNSEFWRFYRQPTWSTPSASAVFNYSLNRVTLSWNMLTDPYPADQYQGYIVLRNSINSFSTPNDGRIYTIGEMIGSAKVLAIINSSTSASFIDNLDAAACGQTYYYRIYGYRFNGSFNNHPARGRAYNENNFASASVFIQPLQVSVSISTPATTVPSGTQVTVTATPTNVGDPSNIKWFKNNSFTGLTGLQYTFIPQNGDQVYAFVDLSPLCATQATSNIIQFEVLGCNAGVINGPNFLCYNSPPANYTTTGSAGGIWSSNNPSVATVNASGLVTVLAAGTFTLKYTLAADCFAEKTISVNPQANAGPDQNLCGVLSTTLTGNAALVGGGFWSQVDGPGIINFIPGYTSPNPTIVATQYGTYQLNWVLESCNSSDMITVQFNERKQVSVSATASALSICAGQAVTYTATPQNGGLTPVYQWFVNNVPQPNSNSPAFTYIPQASDLVHVVLTSSEDCVVIGSNPATSNSVWVEVKPLATAPTAIEASETSICDNFSDPIVLTAEGGSGEVFRWYAGNCGGSVIGEGTSLVLNPPPVTTTVYYGRWETTGCNVSACQSIAIFVEPLIIPSLQISPNTAQSICQGESLTFVAIATPLSPTPQYQWLINGVVVPGYITASFNYAAFNNGDQISCKISYNNSNCILPASITSTSVSVNVSPLVSPVIQISDATPIICSGTPLNLTTSFSNGGDNPAFQWYINGNPISGATNSSLINFTGYGAGSNVFKVVMTSSANCVSFPEAEDEFTVVANAEVMPSVSISASSTSICSGNTVTFTVDELLGGGTSPVLQWRVNGLDIPGQTAMNFQTSSLNNGDEVDCQLTSSDACALISPVYSAVLTMNVTTTVNPTIVLTSDLTQSTICLNTPVHFMATATNGGNTPEYAWYINNVLVPDAVASSFTFNSTNTGSYSVVVKLTSSETCTSANPVYSLPVNFTVLPERPVSINLTASPPNACQGSVVTINSQATNPGPNPNFEWYRNGILIPGVNTPSYTDLAQAGDSWQVKLISNAICAVNNPALSNVLVPNIIPLPTMPVELIADRDNICANDDGNITLTATGGNGTVLQWFSGSCNGTSIGTGNNLVIASPTTTTTYFARYQNSCGVSSCQSVTVNVNQSILPQISINPPAATPCNGEELTLTTNVSGQGSNPVYSWTINGTTAGGNTSSLTAVFNDADVVVCTMQSSETCANPTAATDSHTMEMQPLLTPQINISADQTVVCEGTGILFTSNISNGGTNPSYQWNINNQFLGDENPTLLFAPLPGTYTINCLLTSSEACVTQENAISNEITVTITANVLPNISIQASQTQICTGTEVSFTATPTNGGDAPTYEWYRNTQLIPGENNPVLTISPNDGDVFYCQLQSNANCANPASVQSQTITIEVVNNILPEISIAADATTVCNGNQVAFTSSIAGGGNAPAFSWFVNNVLWANTPDFSYIPSDQDEVYCQMISSDACADPQMVSSEPILLSVAPQVEASISITADATEVCENTPVTFDASILNGGDNPAFMWFVNDEPLGNTAQLVQAFEAGMYNIRCELTSDAFCVSNPTSSSNLIVLEVFATIEPSVNIAASQTIVCEGVEVQLSATVTGEGTNPVMEWYVNGVPQGVNGLMFTYIPANGDEVWFQLNSDAVCAEPQQLISESITLTVSSTITPIIQIETSQTTICAGTEISVAAYASGGGLNPSFQWFVNDQAVGENATYLNYTPNHNDVIYCVLTSSDACADPTSISSNTIEYSVSNPLLLEEILLNDASCNENNGSVSFMVSGGNGNAEYSIDGGNSWSNNPAFSNLAAGIFSYQLRDGVICAPINGQFTIAQSGSPEIDQIITSNASNGFDNGSATIIANGNNLEYSLNNIDWQQNPVFSNLAEGSYPIIIRDANGCVMVSSFQILSDAVKLSLTNAIGCRGNELTVNLSTQGIPTSKELYFHLNFNHLQLQFEQAVSLHAAIPQSMLTTDHTIPGNLIIQYIADNSFTIPGAAEMIEVQFTALEEGNSNLLWSENSFIRSANFEERPIDTENASITIDLGTDFSIEGINRLCQGEELHIELKADGAFDAVDWYNPAGDWLSSGITINIPEAKYAHGGTYTAVLHSYGNCSREKSIEVIVELCEFKPGIPNAFRPTSYPPNNTFKPVFGPIIPHSFEMRIFNSWGQQIFYTIDYNIGWDGTYRGNLQPHGNYVYIVRYTINPTEISAGLTKEVRGSVMLVR